MKVCAVINAHDASRTIIDTIDSIFCYMTKNVLVVVDGANKEFDSIKLPVCKLQGFRHDFRKSPYRNVALGLKTAYEIWPESDWFCYSEYDCLWGSDQILKNLSTAREQGVWMLGNDGHVENREIPLVDALIKAKLSRGYYLLGACQFFSKRYMDELNEISFFEKFIALTNHFPDGYMPGYSGYDISEHLYPTLARQFGGSVGVFATYDRKGKWHGHHKVFPIRFRPELDPETENFPEASIMHPLKDYNHPIRVYHRHKRKKLKNGDKSIPGTSDKRIKI